MADRSLCKIQDCGKAHYGRGWCKAHYERWRVHGNPHQGGKITSPGEPLRWLNEVALNYEDRDACLKWPYATISAGYGDVWLDGRLQYVHRIICEHRHGPPPTPEHQAAHSCGKGHEGCANPWHLDWKTSAENSADRVEHDTHNRGERQWLAKLTESDVHNIRGLLASGMLQREIAARFGVARETIGAIGRKKSWAWLDDGSEVKNENAA